MVDQSKAQPQTESAETQSTPMPSEEQKTPEPEASVDARPQGEGKAELEGAGAKLPEGVKERTTEQFEKLKNQLAEERSKRIKAEKVFTDLKQTSQPNQQVQTKQPQPTVPDSFNPETNEISKLTQQVKGIIEADQVRQEREAFTAYPTLDPRGEKFNETFHNAVSGLLSNSLVKGEKITFKEAADQIVSLSKTQIEKAEKAGADKALEQLTPKEQASLEATGRSDKRLESLDELADLQRRTRNSTNQRDSLEAIVTRMKRSTSSK